MGKVWFGGDRTVEQQMVGLQKLWMEVKGKTVLDVGCAEGAISHECKRRGARYVHGVEHRRDAVDYANKKYAVEGEVSFACRDANTWSSEHSWDVVLLLSVLHKLRNPTLVLQRMAVSCNGLCVIRLPGDDWPILKDQRSGNEPHNLERVMDAAGFDLEDATEGATVDPHPPEWIGYFRRRIK